MTAKKKAKVLGTTPAYSFGKSINSFDKTINVNQTIKINEN